MSDMGRGVPAQSATADREIDISRVIDAPRELVFEAFTDVRHLSRWWGPEDSPPPPGPSSSGSAGSGTS
ncbi:hypothetical protein PJ267_07705 [Arthrobacter sp. OVS8]|nr:hypothetical protein PJ267_07705 [Arthrobacter sp. OVS8]